MALRINAAQQAFYIHETEGHTVPSMAASWTVLGAVEVHTDNNTTAIFCTRYPNAAPSGWMGSYLESDGSTLMLHGGAVGGIVSSGGYPLAARLHPYSIHFNGGTNRLCIRLDGVVVQEITVAPPTDTDGDRSVQWAGYGIPALPGFVDSTWQRWRMWSADLSELECYFEHRSATPVRSSGLLHDWPMVSGASRFADNVGGEPPLSENPSVPIGDGTDLPLVTYTRVYFGTAGTSASGTASAAPSYPVGTIDPAIHDLWCAVTGRSNTAATAPSMPGGWTLVPDSELEGGTGTWAADAGTRRVCYFRKDTVSGTETGTVTVSLGGGVTTNNTLRATIFTTVRPPGTTLQVAATTGQDTTNGTGFSATGSATLALDVGDLVMVGVGQNIDTGTQSAVALSATGIEFAPRQSIRSDAVTNGNDHRHILDAFHVLAGSATVAPTYSYTISAAGSGAVSFLRLRALAGGSASLTASGASVAAATAALEVVKGLTASAAAQASASASLLYGVRLSAAGIANASGSAAMSHAVPLQASAAAVAVAGAQLALSVELSAAGLAAALASASVSVGKPLSAAGVAQVAGTAALQVASGAGLSAAGTAQASAAAVLSLSVRLGAAAVAQALASAALATGKPLSASGGAQATGSASLQVTAGNELTAHGAAQASGSAALQLQKPLSAAAFAQAAAGASLQVGNAATLQAAGASQAYATAVLQLNVPLTAQAIAQAIAGGSLQLTVPLSASALAQASATAQFQPEVQMSAHGAAIASAGAVLQVVGEFARAPLGGTGRYNAVRPVRGQAGGRPSRTMTTRRPSR